MKYGMATTNYTYLIGVLHLFRDKLLWTRLLLNNTVFRALPEESQFPKALNLISAWP